MPVIPCPDCQREVSTLAPACPHCGRPSPAVSSPVAPTAAIPAQEETLWQGSPAWTLLLGYIFAIALTLVLVPLLTYLAASGSADLQANHRVIRAGWTITAVLVLIEMAIFFVALLRLRSTIYTVTNQRVMIETGLFTKSLSEIDLRYIEDSQFFQSFIHRMLGIGNVTLVSSDKTTPVFAMRAVRDPRAVREMIRAQSYKVSQRQLFTRAT